MALSRRAEDVIGGDLTVREPVRSETYELRTLSEGMEQMIVWLNAQIQEMLKFSLESPLPELEDALTNVYSSKEVQ